MKLKYTPYPSEETKRLEWHLVIKYMHGDADSHTSETYVFDTEEAFVKVLEFFNKWRAFKSMYINLWYHGESKGQVAARLRRYLPKEPVALAKELKHIEGIETVINDLLGEHDSMPDQKSALEDEVNLRIYIPGDATTDHQYRATIDIIEDMIYYNSLRTKMKIEIT